MKSQVIKIDISKLNQLEYLKQIINNEKKRLKLEILKFNKN